MWCYPWGGSRIFRGKGILAPKVGRCQPITRPNFPENCKKIKKIEPRGGTHIQIFTARKPSLRRLCFHRCLSVHRGRGSSVSVRGSPSHGGLCQGNPLDRDPLKRDPWTETPTPDRDSPGQRPPWTETPSPGQRPPPLDRDPLPWTETPPLDRDLL